MAQERRNSSTGPTPRTHRNPPTSSWKQQAKGGSTTNKQRTTDRQTGTDSNSNGQQEPGTDCNKTGTDNKQQAQERTARWQINLLPNSSSSFFKSSETSFLRFPIEKQSFLEPKGREAIQSRVFESLYAGRAVLGERGTWWRWSHLRSFSCLSADFTLRRGDAPAAAAEWHGCQHRMHNDITPSPVSAAAAAACH